MFNLRDLQVGDYFQEFGENGEIITRKVTARYDMGNGLVVIRSEIVEIPQPEPEPEV